MFQFLLGRLETVKRDIKRLALAKFQFLLGRLETLGEDPVMGVPCPFQFLLGRLETLSLRLWPVLATGVSIPLR